MKNGISPIIEERILTASKIVVKMLAKALIHAGAEDMSILNFRILDLINQGVDKPTDIAKEFSVALPTLSSILEKLENMGFLTRNISMEDRRRVILNLTNSGQKLVKNVNDFRMHRIASILKKMSNKDKKSLESSLLNFIYSYKSTKGEI